MKKQPLMAAFSYPQILLERGAKQSYLRYGGRFVIKWYISPITILLYIVKLRYSRCWIINNISFGKYG